jgi:hypothetical protein
MPYQIEDDTPAGEAARAAFGERVIALNAPQYAAAGLNFGYFYDASPIIAYNGAEPPPYTMGDFTESTVPGCRVPHAWLADGRSLLDAFGSGYTLIRTDPSIDVDMLETAARDAGVPFTIVDLIDPSGYDLPLVLARPDHHIAWSGTSLPDDPATLIAHLTRLPAPIRATPTF